MNNLNREQIFEFVEQSIKNDLSISNLDRQEIEKFIDCLKIVSDTLGLHEEPNELMSRLHAEGLNAQEKCNAAVRENPLNISDVPVKFLTEALLFEAIELNPYCILNIPKHLITYWIARKAVREDIGLLGMVHCVYKRIMEEEGIIKYKKHKGQSCTGGEWILNEAKK